MKRLRLISAVLWTVIILMLCWTPDVYLPVDEDPNSWKIMLHVDKIVHLGIFAVFTVLWLRALPATWKWSVALVLAGLALAAITEVVQNVPLIHREGEVQDAAADFAGVLLGFPLCWWIESVLKKWRARPTDEEVAGAAASSQ
ncbi:MAG: VanZ family protein [Isosphaeraceae bacterium]